MTSNDQSADAYDFLVSKADLHETEFVDAGATAQAELKPGQLLLAIDCYAFTANNITYAVFGDMMNYWKFFPAPEGKGRIPVWGFATVERSAHDDIAVGERLYGYLPMSTHLIVQADGVTASGFFDASPHRQELHALYNQISRTAGDVGYDPEREGEQMIFRPLFMTAFLIDDLLDDAGFLAGSRVIISSASSKTSLSTAFLLAQHREARAGDGYEIIGLTSAGNREFVEGLGCYDRVVCYEDIEKIPAAGAAAFVDMAGDSDVTSRIHHHFTDNLKLSLTVGGTHWDKVGGGADLPGPAGTFFFAPDQLAKRMEDWGAAGFQSRTAKAWGQFLGKVDGWIEIVRAGGPSDIQRVYLDALDGRATPDKGHVLNVR